MRPVYEREDHKRRERETIDEACFAWGAQWTKLPQFSVADYQLHHEGESVAWVEVKCRNYQSSRFTTLILSARKFVDCLQLALQSGRPFILLVRWEDGIQWLKPEWGQYELQPGGRMDRGDPHDQEPCVHLPIRLFRKLNTARPRTGPRSATSDPAGTSASSPASEPRGIT